MINYGDSIPGWKSLADFDSAAGEQFLDTASDGRIYHSKTYKLQNDGAYAMKANDGFTVSSYGFDDYDSYGYPASFSADNLEKTDSLPPVFIFHQECWGDVINYYDPSYNKDPYWGGVVHDEPEIDPENMSKLALFYMDNEDSYNYKIQIQAYQVGIDYKTLFNLHVVDRTSNARAHLVATDRRGNRADTVIEFFPIVLQIDPYKWDAGLLKPTDAPVKKTFTITNKTPGVSLIPEGLILKTMKENLPSQGFSISVDKSSDLTTPLPTGKSINFYVTFTPSTVGTFKDSIGVGDDCIFRMQAFVKAHVGKPVIRADDASFSFCAVNNRTNQQIFYIHNSQFDGSNTELTIKRIEFDSLMVGDLGSGKPYEIELPDGRKLNDVTEDNPIYVSLDESLEVKVSFQPQVSKSYAAEIRWISDADQLDNLSLLLGTGYVPQLTVTGEDWMKRRADINFYKKDPVGVYAFNAYPSPNGAIKLTNSGSDVVTLTAPEIQDDQNGSDFEVSVGGVWKPLNEQVTLNDIFNGMKIGAGKDTTIPVFFHPGSVSGAHSLSIAFKSDASEKPVCTLNGIGIWGRLGWEDVDFGKRLITSEAGTDYIKIVNENWVNSDLVTITGFKTGELNNATISSNPNGNVDFVYYLNNIHDNHGNILSMPITIQPGDTIFIPITFKPQTAGQEISAKISTISDAEEEISAKVLGIGETSGINPPNENNSNSFWIKPAAPNPIRAQGADIEFSVGCDNSFTEIKIYDANMKLISIPISETLMEGVYSARVPIEKMASGVYFIKMVSSNYTSPIIKCVVEK